MSVHSTEHTEHTAGGAAAADQRTSLVPEINRLRGGAHAMAGIGILAFLVGAVVLGLGRGAGFAWKEFFSSYLFAYIFWLCMTLGCFGITLLHHSLRGSWSLSILRIMEAGNKTLPYMALLFVPLAFPMLVLIFNPNAFADLSFYPYYHWADHHHVENDPILRHKAPYLNPIFWTIRAVIYFAAWIALANFLNRSSLKQDRTLDERLAQTRTNWATPGLVVFVLTVTFAFTDWVMSLDPHWFSTIYGVWFITIQALSAICLGTFIVTKYYDRRPYLGVVTPALTRDLGNMILGFVMFWAYISLSQFLIIWSGNLPEEITFYVDRFKGTLVLVGAFLIIFQFFVPFLCLLSSRTKRVPDLLRKVAGGILIIRVIDMFWQTTPYMREGKDWANPALYLMDFAALLAIGGIWLAVFANELRKHPLIPRHDTRLVEAAAAAHAAEAH